MILATLRVDFFNPENHNNLSFLFQGDFINPGCQNQLKLFPFKTSHSIKYFTVLFAAPALAPAALFSLCLAFVSRLCLAFKFFSSVFFFFFHFHLFVFFVVFLLFFLQCFSFFFNFFIFSFFFSFFSFFFFFFFFGQRKKLARHRSAARDLRTHQEKIDP